MYLFAFFKFTKCEDEVTILRVVNPFYLLHNSYNSFLLRPTDKKRNETFDPLSVLTERKGMRI